ncbi:uncharacterized protein LACBIDRAFT_331068 [Laccaria bicolor S238N-H82]|uniref:Predicted protein n=1 Tax=Laccaria bicolor (strain S238N-H82 / ATCC MYA-4686) TaxID=486041 RepID=B0DNC6_LACBS|nr:uncharacterized protein LACBIDRAFT_331068 [Laccaria bicolor S238N-H82]EDR03846.1 predicted protein [Laccaria bicolor S238N-H82]|eukprot:XP_001885414.1 predicted protein [Laccaria bicolor S238N-H82]
MSSWRRMVVTKYSRHNTSCLTLSSPHLVSDLHLQSGNCGGSNSVLPPVEKRFLQTIRPVDLTSCIHIDNHNTLRRFPGTFLYNSRSCLIILTLPITVPIHDGGTATVLLHTRGWIVQLRQVSPTQEAPLGCESLNGRKMLACPLPTLLSSGPSSSSVRISDGSKYCWHVAPAISRFSFVPYALVHFGDVGEDWWER